ncbi:DMT family transporter [Rickettsia endosymbiont of Halotydeus destructor]|uniref:DMT family transporter n=1 Tax=Rickettsia endosymbiont of Halotydeus destructor TaxID=2996754 RepID=UPI003BB04876
MAGAWVLLIIAGLFEVAFTVSLKLSEGFTKLKPTVAFLIFSLLSFLCLTRTLNKIPLGTAYGVWTGMGATGAAIIGILYFNEPYTTMRIFFITTMIISIIGLKMS